MALIYEHFAGRNGSGNGSTRTSSAPHVGQVALFNLDGTLLRIEPATSTTSKYASLDAYMEGREAGIGKLRSQGNFEAHWLYQQLLTEGLRDGMLVARTTPGAREIMGGLRGQGLEIAVFSTMMPDGMTAALDQTGLHVQGAHSTWTLPCSPQYTKTQDSFRIVNAMLGGTTHLYTDDSSYVLSHAAHGGLNMRPGQAVKLYHLVLNGDPRATSNGIIPIRTLSEVKP